MPSFATAPLTGVEPNGGCAVLNTMPRHARGALIPGPSAPQGLVQRGDLRPDRARRVRDTFLTTGTADFAAVEAAGISPHVFDSWRRCLRYGLAGDDVRPVRRTAIDLESQLTTVVDAVVSRRDAVLEQSMCGLSLTDGEGTVLRQWVRDRRIGRWLERNDIVPTFVVDETSVGTTSGMCLLSGKPTMVRGPEHFFEKYDSVTSAGVPVVHPVTHRVVGSLNLTSRFEDTSPVLLSWVMDLVRDVQRAFQESATRRERILMNAYLSENRDVRHPLVALNEQTIITNATAARLLTSVDQALLWEHTSRAIHDGGQEARRLVLNNGTVVSVECKQITDGGVAAGAVLSIRPVVERSTRTEPAPPVPALGQLAGKGPRWRELCRRAHHTGTGPVLVTGERGTGKLAVARVLADGMPVAVVDGTDAAADGGRSWLRGLEDHLSQPAPAVVVIRHCDELDLPTSTAAAKLVRACHDGPVRVIATAKNSARHGDLAPLLAEFTAVLEVPTLRDRLEDLPDLLAALTKPAFERLGRTPHPVRWMPDAVQTLARLDWPGNVASLETVVVEVLRTNSNGYISAGDLPVDVVSTASRRKLAGLEQVEATAIITALREARGNKKKAADALGIARSTLYRKTRALGIDLSTAAY